MYHHGGDDGGPFLVVGAKAAGASTYTTWNFELNIVISLISVSQQTVSLGKNKS